MLGSQNQMLLRPWLPSGCDAKVPDGRAYPLQWGKTGADCNDGFPEMRGAALARAWKVSSGCKAADDFWGSNDGRKPSSVLIPRQRTGPGPTAHRLHHLSTQRPRRTVRPPPRLAAPPPDEETLDIDGEEDDPDVMHINMRVSCPTRSFQERNSQWY
jgi:hypothetical protein